MILDNKLYLSDAQTICNSGTTEYSTSYVDFGSAVNFGKGEPLAVVITVDELFAGTGTTLTISLVTATASDLTTGQVVLYSTPAIAKASLTAGRAPIVLPLPPLAESGSAQRYFGLKFVGDNTFETTGKMTAYLTEQNGIQTNV
jgi:hypothetical protein